jgi:BirA family biotin operon repressor/biotin-[acetyl-CoA-carboxylase] ligase
LYKIHPKTLFIGKTVQYFTNCYSTNDLATEIIQRKEAFEGMLLITDNQLAGRGQRGNSWEAHPGMNITLSIILKPTFLPANRQFDLNIAVSLAIFDLLSTQSVPALTIKWPNDVYVGDLKMGGVLIENILAGNSIDWSVIGIGLNINQIQFENEKATSLRVAKQGKEYDIPALVQELSERIEQRYLELRSDRTVVQRAYYLENLYRFEEWHPFTENGSTFAGKITGVGTTGKLVLETQQQIKEFDFKEVGYVIQ